MPGGIDSSNNPGGVMDNLAKMVDENECLF